MYISRYIIRIKISVIIYLYKKLIFPIYFINKSIYIIYILQSHYITNMMSQPI